MGKTQQDRAVIDLVINGQQAKTTLKDVSLAVTRTRSELNKMKQTDPGYKEKLAEMHKLVNAQREMTARINDTTTAWGRFKKEMATVTMGVVGGNVITFALQQLVQLIPGAIDHTMKLKDAFADIEKATGLSTDGVKKLNKELKGIDTRTTNSELRDIAIAGGQLGVANDELVEFVRNTDMAVVALGDEFTGGVEQVAKEIGGIGKLFKETREQAIGESINQIGSALNELGAAGAATSPVVAEFTTRMGQLGDLAPKLHETLGLGAALQELGLSAEIGSSGLSGLLLTASTRSELFAQHLGMSKQAIEELISTNPNGFLMKMAESLRGLSATQVAQRLKELKVESQESIKVMMLLADQTDFVKEKQDLASKAMAEGTSLTDEFSKKNHQLARDLKDLKEWFNSLLTSEGLQEFLVNAIHNTVEFIKVLPQLGQWLEKNSEIFYLSAAATLAYHGAIIKATVAAVANTTAELYRKVAYEVGFKWLVIQEAATKAYALATGVLTGQITLQTAAATLARGAWAALNAVMLANPVGAVVAAFTALAYAVKLYSDNTEAALRIEREKVRLQRDLQLTSELHKKTLDELSESLGDYNEMNQAERAEYVRNIAMARLDLESRLARLKAREKEMEMMAAEPSLWQKLWAAIKSGGNAVTMVAEFNRQARENVQEIRKQFASGIESAENDLKKYDGILKQVTRYEKPSTTGAGKLNTISDPDEAKKASEKRQKVAENEAEQLEKMLADSRKRIMAGEESDYEKEVAAFADKYSRMYELAKTNQEKIDEIRRLSLEEFAEIDRRRKEKEDEDKRKQDEADNKLGYKSALGAADQTRAGAQTDIDRQRGVAGESDIRMQELQADQAYLTQKLLLEQTFAQESADTQRELTENWNEQVRLRAETEIQYAQAMKQAELSLQQAKEAALTEGLNILKSFLKQNTIAYKAAIVAQKAYAIAQVIVDTQREIAGIWANPTFSLMPDGGVTLKTSLSTAAKVRAGISLATIAAQGVQELAAKKDGGFTSVKELYGNPSGFVDSPTLFNLGRRSYIAGEAGREFVINNRALQEPVVANFARIMDVVQKSGNYSMLSATQVAATSGASGGSSMGAAGGGGISPDLVMMLIREQQMTRQALEQYASRPISFDFFAHERRQEQVQQIRSENKL